jgi:hypothetical protein
VETLLATCASAGATLVAIIGGLLISRYLTIDSEVRGAAQQLASVTARLTDAKSESDRAEREAAIYDMEWSFDDSDIYEELRKAARGQPLDLEKVKRIDSSLTAYADEQILATAEPWLQEIRVALSSQSWSDVQRDDWWSDFRLRNPLPITIEAVWEQEFERVRKRLPEPKGLLFATPIIRPSINAGAWQRDELNRLRTLSDERRNDKLLLEAQHRLLISNSAAKPRGLWSGAVVLAILTVTTVVIPILYLTPSAQRGPLSAPMITGILLRRNCGATGLRWFRSRANHSGETRRDVAKLSLLGVGSAEPASLASTAIRLHMAVA